MISATSELWQDRCPPGYNARRDTEPGFAPLTPLNLSPTSLIDRNGKADVFCAGSDGGIDADYLAAQVEQRAAGVAGINGGIGLNDARDGFFRARIGRRRSDVRESPETTPTETVLENWPSALPIAIAVWPSCRPFESPRVTVGNPVALI